MFVWNHADRRKDLEAGGLHGAWRVIDVILILVARHALGGEVFSGDRLLIDEFVVVFIAQLFDRGHVLHRIGIVWVRALPVKYLHRLPFVVAS